jgi:cell wall-associated NlpC family hydrolase
MVEFTPEQKSIMINAAEAIIGNSWKSFGREVDEGLDCYGFVMYVYASVGIKLPDPAKSNTPIFDQFEPFSHGEFGDIYHTRGSDGVDHVGIVLTKTKGAPFIAECVKKYGVRIVDIRTLNRIKDITYYRLKVNQ